MNYSYFLILLCLVPFLFADSFAEETYRGDIYTDTLQPDGITHVWNSESQRYVETGNLDSQGRKIYTHYILDDQPTYVQVTNGDASFVFDKTTCSAQIFSRGIITGDSIISSDSYVPKFSTDGSGIWSIVNSVNDASCVTSIEETPTSIKITGTKQSSQGIFKISYLKEEGHKLKTILEATNLTSLTDKRFGVTQTQSIPQIITFGGQQRDLTNYIGQTFDRTWLENNQANLFEFSQGLQFDVIDAWQQLESITVNSVNGNIASVSFNYLRNTPILLPNDTLVIDPTFGYTVGTEIMASMLGVASVSCSPTGLDILSTGTWQVYKAASGTATNPSCMNTAIEFDTTSIPDGSIIQDTLIRYDVESSGGINCNWTAIPAKPSSLSNTAANAKILFDNINNGTKFVDNDSSCASTGNNKSLDLGSTADSDVRSHLGANWWAVGIGYDNYARSAGSGPNTFGTGTFDVEVQITYTEPSLDIDFTALDVEIIGDAAKITGSVNITSDIVTPIPNTEIILFANGSSFYTNSTVPSGITPFAVDFGPAWLQMTTDNVYNFTAQVSADGSFDDPIDSYPFDDDVFDAVGINNGTVTGTETYVAGEINEAFSFDGASYITLANESNFDYIDYDKAFSFTLWLKSSLTGVTQKVIAKANDQNSESWTLLFDTLNRMGFNMMNPISTNEVRLKYTPSLLDGNWHHVVLTKSFGSSAASFSWYVDGVYSAPDVITDTMNATIASDNIVVIGAESDGGEPFTGILDEVKFYDYELSSDQVSDLFLLGGSFSATNSNSTSVLSARQYDPDYFTAIDPTQGLVNYTFSDNNFLNVNRDTNSTLFNVECRYFTQAQAFQNLLSEGTWDNQTDVLFYTNDASGYYYVQCFNDGELFITAISQNFTNALVPGLIIFDQLGGFFGAPSIILVIISILSLGTGRNYPIIMLIAASVTGMLLALELLVLDPGLVVAIIIMTGIGLFGIRKFY